MNNVNDFGCSVKRYIYPGPDATSWIPVIRQNMELIAKVEGFVLQVGFSCYYPRDAHVRLSDGRVVSGKATPNTSVAVFRSVSKQIYFKENTLGNTTHPVLMGFHGFSSQEELQTAAKFEYACRHSGSAKRPELRYFLEGGDIFNVTNQEGKRKILIGRDVVDTVHNQLRMDGVFKDLPAYAKELTASQIKKVAEEMFSMGLFKLRDTSGFIDLQELFKPIYPHLMSQGEMAQFSGLRKPFEWKAGDAELAKPIVAKYLAQREAVLQWLSEDFSVPVEDIHLMTKGAYHLDTFMMPGPQNCFFLQSHALCAKHLAQLRETVDKEDRQLLEEYIEEARQCDKELGGVFQTIQKELAAAGFRVIETPGVFMQKVNPESNYQLNINFLNFVSGWSETNKRTYLITTGAEVGKGLGKQLMKLFKEFISQFQANLKVYFVGYNPQKTDDFSHAMSCWNGSKMKNPQAGIHCLLFEEELHPIRP